MLTMIGTALALAGLAWLVHNRITGRWEARGRSLGYLNGTLTVIGRHIGRDLETGQGREQFIRECRELIRKGTLTRNIDGRRDALTNSVVQCGERELERQIFSPPGSPGPGVRDHPPGRRRPLADHRRSGGQRPRRALPAGTPGTPLRPLREEPQAHPGPGTHPGTQEDRVPDGRPRKLTGKIWECSPKFPPRMLQLMNRENRRR